MLSQIFKNEWRLLVADRTLISLAALFTVLVGFAVFNGNSWTRFQRSTIEQAQAEQRQRIASLKRDLLDYQSGRREAKGFLDPRGAASIGGTTAVPYLVMEPTALAPLSVGQSDLYPYFFKAGLGSKETVLSNDELENPINLLSGRFDLSFVMVYFFPLLVLTLSYNIISAEKEQGTLALSLAQPLSLRTLVLGKIAVRFSILVLLAAVLCVTSALIIGVSLLDTSILSSLVLWTAVVGCYAAFWFGAAVLVNVFGKSSSMNAMSLAGLWLAFVLLIPSIINVAATALYPVPSRVELIQATRTATKDISQKGSMALAHFLEDHPDLVSSAPNGKGPDASSTSYAVQTEVERKVRPLLDQFDVQLDRQQKFVDYFRFSSPAMLAQSAFNDLSGTSVERYRYFLFEAGDYLNSWRDYFLPKIFRHTRFQAQEVDEFPQFIFVEEPRSVLVSRVLWNLAGLSIALFLVGVLSLALIRRFPITG